MNLSLGTKYKSLEPFTIELPDFVILTGINGAGKTQLLTAIMQNLLIIIDTNGSQMDSKKYVTSQTLAPNESTIVTREQLNSNTNNLWNQYSNYLSTLMHNPGYDITNIFGYNSPHVKVIDKITKSAKKTKERINFR